MSTTPPELSTLCAHAGLPRTNDIGAGARSHVSPLYHHSVFDFPSIDASKPALAGEGYVYRRHGVPNTDELGAAVARLEGAEAGLATSSGMSAIAAAVLGTCQAGDRVVVQRDAYGGTSAFLNQDLARFGMTVVPVDCYDLGAFETAVLGARVALVESVSNPLLRECDIRGLANLCHRAGTLLIVDNTFATPLRQRPRSEGAHLVVHSVTKFLGGHHDLCAGAVVGDSADIEAARGIATRLGLVASPMDAWLAVRGIRTLEVRMTRAWETSASLAYRLAKDPRVGQVCAADRCALVSFDLGSADAADRFVSALNMITLSPSLGGVTTTVSHPATSSHKALSPQARAEAGIADGLVRISVGVEHADDIWADINAAVDAAS